MLTLIGGSNPKPFNEIISAVNQKILGPADNKGNNLELKTMNVLIIFDEIEKWLHSYVKFMINKMREESRKKSYSNGNGGKDASLIIERAEKLTGDDELKYIKNKRRIFRSTL